MLNYHNINKQVMIDTVNCCETIPELKTAIKESIRNQTLVLEEEKLEDISYKNFDTEFICSGKRSFEAAKGYPGKRIAVLNFANNHTIGGKPFSAGAQEESLCRCSTLYPCLQAMEEPFYKKHQIDFSSGKISELGTDDIIYTPDVIVFKTDERTDPVYPKMMPHEDWYKVNIITCAAPELRNKPTVFPYGYVDLINKRIKRILDVAAREKNEVLILGAWGCGAFGNSQDIVASSFVKQLVKYNFETVEFALSTGDGSNSAFSKEIEKIKSKKNSESSKRGEYELVKGDITSLHCDVIVNAANESLRRGGGVCGCIHRVAGPRMEIECISKAPCPTGSFKFTGAYNLPCKEVAHAVGPIWQGGTNQEAEKLANCYEEVIKAVYEKGYCSVAFPFISSNIFGYPREECANVALTSIRKMIEIYPVKVIMCAYSDDDYKLFQDVWKGLESCEAPVAIDNSVSTKTYVQVIVPIYKRSPFLGDLKRSLYGLGIKWDKVDVIENFLQFHLTLAFINRVPSGVDVNGIITQSMRGKTAPMVPFDNVFAFTGKHDPKHFISLRPSFIPLPFMEMITSLRENLIDAGCELSPGYLFHVTLGRINIEQCNLNTLETGISRMMAFKQDIQLSKVQYVEQSEHKVLAEYQWD